MIRFAIFLGFLLACGSCLATQDSLASDSVLFVKSYQNCAWGAEYKGILAAEVEKMAGLISQVENASYSADVHTACDAGTDLWLAYRQDEISGKLKKVLLHKSGDLTQKSDSPAAKILVEWLDKLVKK